MILLILLPNCNKCCKVENVPPAVPYINYEIICDIFYL